MNLPTHHLPEDWIVAEAAGTNPTERSLLIAVHETLCPQCRQRGQEASRIASVALEMVDPIALPPGAWSALEAQLDAPITAEVSVSSEWPAPLAPFVDGKRWRWLAPGIWGIDVGIQTTGSMPMRLMWLPPGTDLHHKDGGEESAVLLRGGWTDQTGHYRAGDVYHHAGHGHHEQVIDPGEPCVALILNAAPTVLPKRWMRMLFKV